MLKVRAHFRKINSYRILSEQNKLTKKNLKELATFLCTYQMVIPQLEKITARVAWRGVNKPVIYLKSYKLTLFRFCYRLATQKLKIETIEELYIRSSLLIAPIVSFTCGQFTLSTYKIFPGCVFGNKIEIEANEVIIESGMLRGYEVKITAKSVLIQWVQGNIQKGLVNAVKLTIKANYLEIDGGVCTADYLHLIIQKKVCVKNGGLLKHRKSLTITPRK